MKSAAILIGLNTYPKAAKLKDLTGAIHDCQDVAALLLKHGLIDPDYLYAYVHDTTAPSVHVTGARPLLDPMDVPPNGIVSRDTLLRTLANVINPLGYAGVERLFVYLSGHGGDVTLAVPPVSVLLTTDFERTGTSSNLGMLVTDHIQNMVHNAPLIKEAVIISDSCRTALPALTVVPHVGATPQFNLGTQCLTIKSSVHSKPATEADVTGKGRVVGTFTHLLLQELDAALTQNPTGPVRWRAICDAVAEQQEKSGSGQRLDYQQVTAYPLMDVRGAPPSAAPQPTPTVTLRSPATPALHAAARAVPNSGQGPYPTRLHARTVNNVRFSETLSMAFNPVFIAAEHPVMQAATWPGPTANVDVQQVLKEVSRSVGAALGWRPPPSAANPQDVYRHRSLINGIAAVQEAFRYLSSADQMRLNQAKRILATEGDPAAVDRLNGTFSAQQWKDVMSFLRRQATKADPLSAVDAAAQADGFTLKVTNVTRTQRQGRRVQLQVDGTNASRQPSTARVYQHPSLLPVVQDVAFTRSAATFVLTVHFGFTVAVKVESGPLLKLDLRTVDGIPRRQR